MVSGRASTKIKSAIVRVLRPVLPSVWDRAYLFYRHAFYNKAGVIFCHVPKNAGSKINFALYGRRLGHIRLSQLILENKKQLPILAVWREPIERFLSACAYARGGGGTDGIIADAELYRGMNGPSDFLNYLQNLPEARRDPVFRSQSYYFDVSPSEIGRGGLVICRISELMKLESLKWFRRSGINFSTRRNVSEKITMEQSNADIQRIEAFYADDYGIPDRFKSCFL